MIVRLKVNPGQVRAGDEVLLEGSFRRLHGVLRTEPPVVMGQEGEQLFASSFPPGRPVTIRRRVDDGICPHCGLGLGVVVSA